MIFRGNLLTSNLSEEQQKALDYVYEFCEEKELDILYTTFFGSKLYGTNTPTSDTDIKGVFLPKKRDLLLEQAPKCVSLHTGDDRSKNDENDVDVEFYSIHSFLHMLERGDTGALDLFFAFTNPEAMLFECSDWKNYIISKAPYLFNPRNTRAFIGYAVGQATKYSVKGDRLAALEKTLEFVKTLPPEDKVEAHMDEILKNCECGSFVKEDFVQVKAGESRTIRSMRVLGKLHMSSLFVGELLNRLKDLHGKYGKRAKSTMDAEGVDWKAMSHAVRVAMQAQDLLLTGKISFPLKYADEIKEIKAGKISFDETVNLLSSKIDDVDNLLKTPDQCIPNNFNKKVQEASLLGFYGEI